jgi:ubiquinone/menaquinone biosynthesis C-methylase UbiE
VTSVEEWKVKIASSVLKDIGFKLGQVIVDFGCGNGIYDVILSKIIGPEGKIYAIDSDEKGLLPQLIAEIKKLKISNIKVIETSGEIEFPILDKVADFVLIYDVMHLIDEDDRDLLIKEASRILKDEGTISYHATHIDDVGDNFVKEIHKLMESNGFILSMTLKRPMFHWAWIQESWIFNYQRKV